MPDSPNVAKRGFLTTTLNGSGTLDLGPLEVEFYRRLMVAGITIAANGVITFGVSPVGITSTPAGSDTQVQFNDNGVLAGNAGLTFIKSTGTITATNIAGAGSNLTSLNASNLSAGTVPDARFPATLPAASGVNLTALNASNLGSGTVPDARFPATLPAASGVNLTALNASNLGSGTVPTVRLASGTANSSSYLRGDQTWATLSLSAYATSGSGTLNLSASNGVVQFVNTTATSTVNLFTAVGNSGYQVTVKNTGTGTITIDGNASETIDGSLTVVFSTKYQSYTLMSDGANWHII